MNNQRRTCVRFVNLGSRAAIPNIAGLRESKPLTHVEALDLQRLPEHLIVLRGGYVGLELGQAIRRFGSRVTLIERGAQLAPREEAEVGDVSAMMKRKRERTTSLIAWHSCRWMPSGGYGLFPKNADS